jgi:quercetin dioxygenase-like cupin family protein
MLRRNKEIVMDKTAKNLHRSTLRISRRIVLQMAPAFSVAAAAAAAVASNTVWAQAEYGQTGPKMTRLLRSDLRGQGNQVQESIVTFVEFQPRQAAPWHMHPGAQEIFYVLEGNVMAEVDGQEATMIGAGGVALIPADVPHSVRNDDANVTVKALVIHSRADKQKPLLLDVAK